MSKSSLTSLQVQAGFLHQSRTKLETINFHGQQLMLIHSSREPMIAIKPICEGVGIDWSGQYQKIKNDPILNSVMGMISTTGADGKRYKMACLPLGYLNGWLLSIDVNRVKPEIKDGLIQYQKECYKVLSDYWFKGVAINQRRSNRSNPLWVEARQEGKHVRKELTDAIQALQAYAVAQGSNNPHRLFINYTGLAYDVLDIPRPKGEDNYRDTFSRLECHQVATMEYIISQAIYEGMTNGEDYHDIYKLAKQRALVVAAPMLAYMGAGAPKREAIGGTYALQ